MTFRALLRPPAASVYVRVPHSAQERDEQCRFPAFCFDVLAAQTWNSRVARPVTFTSVRPVHFPGKTVAYETLRNRHSTPRPREHALGRAGALRGHRLHAA